MDSDGVRFSGQLDLLYKKISATNRVRQQQQAAAVETNVVDDDETITEVLSNRGKKCSNIDCLTQARYTKAFAKMWQKYSKICPWCVGKLSFCPNEACMLAMSKIT